MTAIEKMKQVRLFTNEEASSIINNYLNKKKDKSQQTFRSYHKGFNEFFITLKGKDINTITWDDILSITYNDCLLYQDYLFKEKKNSPQTVNGRLSAINKLFNHLSKHNDKIKISITDIEPLEVNPHETKSIGTLSEKEVDNLLDFCSQRNYKPDLQKLYFKTLFITMLRREVILNLNVNQIKKIKEVTSNKEIYILQTSQKRRHEETAIPDELALELIESSKSNIDGNVFEINIKSLELTLNKFCEEYNIPEDRNISFHSLKKAGVNYAYNNSGKDIARTSKAAHHSDPKVTYNNYLLQNDSLTNQLTYSLHQDKPDINELKSLNKEQLLQLIKSCDSHILRQLIELKNNIFADNK